MANIYAMADTWDDIGTTFTGIGLNVTDTASASDSLLMDLQVGGVSRFTVNKNGEASFGFGGPNNTSLSFGQSSSGFFSSNGFDITYSRAGSKTLHLGFQRATVGSAGYFGYSSNVSADGTVDLFLVRDAANTFAQRNGTNAQTLNIYNTYTDASNYERLKVGWNANALELKPEAAGTGTTRVLHISGLPTSNPGPGILWNNAGNVEVGT